MRHPHLPDPITNNLRPTFCRNRNFPRSKSGAGRAGVTGGSFPLSNRVLVANVRGMREHMTMSGRKRNLAKCSTSVNAQMPRCHRQSGQFFGCRQTSAASKRQTVGRTAASWRCAWHICDVKLESTPSPIPLERATDRLPKGRGPSRPHGLADGGIGPRSPVSTANLIRTELIGDAKKLCSAEVFSRGRTIPREMMGAIFNLAAQLVLESA